MPSSEPRVYRASYDTTTKVLSVVVCIFFAALATVIGSAAFAGIGAVVAGFAALVLALSYAYSPRGYAVSDRSIVVKRMIGDVVIPLEGIREARAATADDFRGCLRLFGSGGLFGYYGLFRTATLGTSTWYVTNRKRAVIVITAAKTTVLSPDDVDGFLAAVHGSAPVPASAPASPPRPAPRSHAVLALIGKLLVAVVIIVAMAGVGFGVLYAPGPPSYALTPESLTIQDRFYPVTLIPSLVDTEHMRIVDLSVEREWWPVERTNGFSNAHYHSGWFRLADGKQVRLYRAGSMRLVLLPGRGGGTAVLLETKDPEAFMDAVRAQWSRR